MFRKKYLWIDMDTRNRPVEEMEEVFQKVFGTVEYTSLARSCYVRDTTSRYCYNTLGVLKTVWGEKTQDPIETIDKNVEVIPLSTLLLGETVLGEL